MYLPSPFRVEDSDELTRFMRMYSFATLITQSGDGIDVSHVPVWIESHSSGMQILGHLAKANPHSQSVSSNTATLIFKGPHSYISPKWYGRPDVPTWNYAAVHAIGQVETFSDRERLVSLLRKLVEAYEPMTPGEPWKYNPEDSEKQLGVIVGFKVSVERVEGKFKLGQNRPAGDQLRMAEELKKMGNSELSELILQRMQSL